MCSPDSFQDEQYPNGSDRHRILDHQTLQERLQNDWELIQAALQMALDDLPGQMENLKQYIHRQDADATCIQAHKIKGMAANICAENVRQTAFEVEKTAKNQDYAQLQVLLSNLEAEVQRLGQVVQDLYPDVRIP